MAEFTSFSKVDYPEPRIFYEELNTFLTHLATSHRFADSLTFLLAAFGLDDNDLPPCAHNHRLYLLLS